MIDNTSGPDAREEIIDLIISQFGGRQSVTMEEARLLMRQSYSSGRLGLIKEMKDLAER